ncbi:hypothetical protein Asulf_01527 [Archaeoglobus sulfaticallidus PM70-1]|uniref:Uncharacterized protein n=1 Tax=Archaeoglobus sulfaticallidus PM70-1 TaxID=387631 RepID=N0BMN9_9EURY|nr:hypothetical protein [Archaeoglobus sulfaticallidus]AGK61505.1 hypothetical protein Asulf_01527 [Archaeoglobus sulfaticallidus PM70-1]
MTPLFDCLVNGTRVSENGKSVSISGDRNEQILFFRIDNCYIKDESKKCDYFALYSDSNYKFIFLIELKGINLAKAIEQFEETITNEKFKYILNIHNCRKCNNYGCIKLLLVVHGRGISSNNDLKDRIYKKYKFILETEELNCDLEEIINKYKNKHNIHKSKLKRMLSKRRR